MPDEPPPSLRSSSLLRESLALDEERQLQPERGGLVLWGLLVGCLILEGARRVLLGLAVVEEQRGTLVVGTFLTFTVYLALVLTVVVGWDGSRWVAGCFAGVRGIYALMWAIVLSPSYSLTSGPGDSGLTVARGFSLWHAIGELLGILLLILAACLLVSRNVAAYIQQRGRRRHWWNIAAPICCFALYFCSVSLLPAAVRGWAQREVAASREFATESMEALARDWDPAVYEARADEDTPDESARASRAQTIRSFAAYGAVKRIALRDAVPMSFDRDGTALRMSGAYTFEIEFEGAAGLFALKVHRRSFQPWKIGSFSFRL